MEPLPYIKVSVGALGLRIPVASKPSRTGVHSSSSPCFCEISLPSLPVQIVPVTLLSATSNDPDSHATAASFYLDEPALQKLLFSSCLKSTRRSSFLKVVVVTGRQGSCWGVRAGKKLGSFRIPVALEWSEGKSVQVHSGWTSIGQGKPDCGRPGAQLHLNVKVEADPRYVFQFNGEPSLSPQIVQVHGNMKQPIFSCKFSRDRNTRTRLGVGDVSLASGYNNGDSGRERKERKGWLVMIHDLSGSPVAAASMVTPFVPSSGSDLVSRSNPGAWLILRPEPTGGVDSWRSWGRLEAWRERSASVGIGCRFQLNAEGGGFAGVSAGTLVSETVLNAQSGGEFLIDTGRLKADGSSPGSPASSPKSSGEFSFTHILPSVGGFVFKTSVKGEKRSIRPVIQLAMRHVTCVEDAAVFMALAAAVDLSVDACQPFSRKLRSELTQPPTPS